MEMQVGRPRTVFFRRKTRATYAVSLRTGCSLRSLLLLLAKRETIAPENILLLHRGKPLDSLEPLERPHPARQSIVHVVNLAEVRKGTIAFQLRGLDGRIRKFSLPSETRVGDFVRESVVRVDGAPYFHVGLVYAGKVLSPQKTLFEEFVEEDCEIVAVDLTHSSRKAPGEEARQGIAEAFELRGGRDGREAVAGQREEEQTARLQAQNEETAEKPINPASDPHQDEKIESAPKSQKDSHNPENSQPAPSTDLLPQREEQTLQTDLEQAGLAQHPPFTIQVSQVNSVDTEEGQHNNVQFYQEEDPFDQAANPETHPDPQLPSTAVQASRLEEGGLSGGEFVVAGGSHEGQTRSFIDRLMRKYKIMFE